MSQSLSKLYIHATFHIKKTSVPLRKEDFEELFAYIAQVLKSMDCYPIQVGGVENHIHVLSTMSKNTSLAKMMEEVKRHSSRWLKTKDIYYKDFSWQGGYGGFSVSQSVVEKTAAYIRNQENHHRKRSFREEYLRFLDEYGVDYNEVYLFSD
jgi:REP element-mobilizing transposase RayT